MCKKCLADTIALPPPVTPCRSLVSRRNVKGEMPGLCACGDRVCEAGELGLEAEVFADAATVKERVESARVQRSSRQATAAPRTRTAWRARGLRRRPRCRYDAQARGHRARERRLARRRRGDRSTCNTKAITLLAFRSASTIRDLPGGANPSELMHALARWLIGANDIEILVDEDVVRPVDADAVDLVLAVAELHDTVDEDRAPRASRREAPV
jgi:hypothetical protein